MKKNMGNFGLKVLALANPSNGKKKFIRWFCEMLPCSSINMYETIGSIHAKAVKSEQAFKPAGLGLKS